MSADLTKINKIYFIGIAGIGMSAVACLAKKFGYQVMGSDQENVYPPASIVLAENEILYQKGYKKENIKNPDLIVIGAGESPETNPEVKEVIKRGIPILSYPELLYHFVRDKYRIVVTGTHGKTTTSSLLAKAFSVIKEKAGFFIGGYVRNFSTNFSLSENKYFVIEGDEYYSSYFDKRPKFLHYYPHLLIITSLDLDHFDYYRNLADLRSKFRNLIKQMPPEGVIVACHDDSNVKKLLSDCDKKVIWYGQKGSKVQWKGEKIRYPGDFMEFEAKNLETKEKVQLKLKIFGQHNVLNTLACIATLFYLKIPLLDLLPAFQDFQGSKRRLEKKGEINGIIIFDDYAHHPTEVKATIAALQEKYPDRKIWAIFEPHTFSRTKATIKELAKSFENADEVIIPDIYPAREKFKKGNIISQEVVDQIKKFHQNVHYLPTKNGVLDYLVENLKANDLVIIMAVGDFNQVADLLVEKLKT